MTKTDIKALRVVRNRLKNYKTGKLGFSGTHTDLIDSETRLWRETWIIPVLDALIGKGENHATEDDLYLLKVTAREGWMDSKL
jgi:hypothetical protein